MVTVAVVEPAEFEAVTRYGVFAEIAVGVPEIVPVELFRLNPAGKAGLTEYEVTVPVTVGASAGMA
jgi:hypothetical protein